MDTKQRVLEMLVGAERELSGQEIAGALGVSRNAVWKAIEKLREEGFRVDAESGRGYRICDASARLSVPDIQKWLTTRCLGRNCEVYGELESTNVFLKKRASEKAPEGTLIVADSQSAGHGRFARPFYSPPGTGIYMSVLFRPRLPAEKAVRLTSCAAVAAAQAVRSLTGLDARVKWVNDVFVNGHKICGILSEAGMDFESGQLEYAVVGIGMNVGKSAFPGELRDVATSLENECGQSVPRARVIAEILNRMEQWYDHLEDDALMDEYKALSNVLGEDIWVLRGEEKFTAVAVDIDRDGSLIVESERGRETVRSGEISVRFRKKEH